jgi:hypothetical protein
MNAELEKFEMLESQLKNKLKLNESKYQAEL